MRPPPLNGKTARNNLLPSGVATTFWTEAWFGSTSGALEGSSVVADRTLSAPLPATYTLFPSGESAMAVADWKLLVDEDGPCIHCTPIVFWMCETPSLPWAVSV